MLTQPQRHSQTPLGLLCLDQHIVLDVLHVAFITENGILVRKNARLAGSTAGVHQGARFAAICVFRREIRESLEALRFAETTTIILALQGRFLSPET
jgi:hypothetical protein